MESRSAPRVKNKAPAPQQISAEQLLREAVDRQEPGLIVPTQRFADLEELHEFQGRKRKEFEDYVQRNRINMNNWMRYAAWELENKEYARARSIFERALDVDSTSVTLWIRYIEAEMKTRNINHARNLLDRAVTILPRIDKLWFKYVSMEEMLGNIPGCRQVFERWMSWEPDAMAWSAYIKLEKRYGEYQRAREIFQRFTTVHPETRNWIKWAKFEEEFGTSELVRQVFGTAVEALGEDFMDEKLFIAFARYEAKQKEFERARSIFKYALDRLPRSKSVELHKAYTMFEKQFGDQEGVEDVVISKRRVQYENEVTAEPKNYDAWLSYARLEEEAPTPDFDRVRDVYERAIAQVPPSGEKRHWRRYIYLWLFYAIFEEAVANDIERARQVYSEALKLVPHSKFTFAKLWVQAAMFEVRQKEITKARKLLGQSLGRCPKEKLFREYIALELRLKEFNRARTLYEKAVVVLPHSSSLWVAFAQFERGLDEMERVRDIYELAVSQKDEDNQSVLDVEGVVWKAYIDFEEEEGHYERARKLYERLERENGHVRIWIGHAKFELGAPDSDTAPESDIISEEAKARARKVFEAAAEAMKKRADEERVELLTTWLGFEEQQGGEEDKEKVRSIQPYKKRERRRREDGMGGMGMEDEWEEVEVWVFPEAMAKREAKQASNLLKLAQSWKAKMEQGGA